MKVTKNQLRRLIRESVEDQLRSPYRALVVHSENPDAMNNDPGYQEALEHLANEVHITGYEYDDQHRQAMYLLDKAGMSDDAIYDYAETALRNYSDADEDGDW
jgi:hypothetical protein